MTPHYKIEFDATVDSILNTAEADLVERGNRNVHWLAVPSLKDIWEEERHRMSALLHPKDNFLSSHSFFSSNSNIDTTTPLSFSTDESKTLLSFTLTRPKGATPNAKDALHGVSKLYGPNELKDIHRDAMKQIVERYSDQIELIDGELQRHSNVSSDDGNNDTESLIEALEALGDQFSTNPTVSLPCTQESIASKESNISDVVDDLAMNNISDKRDFNDFLEYTQSAIDFEKEVEEGKLSIHINPTTLTPFEDDLENDDQEET